MRRVLLQEGDAQFGLSRRGGQQLEEVRALFIAPERRGSLVLEHLTSGRLRWWTFAGGAVNSSLALRLGEGGSTRVDDMWVETDSGVSVLELAHREASQAVLSRFAQGLAERAELKFSACLPVGLLAAVIAGRSLDEANLRRLALQ